MNGIDIKGEVAKKRKIALYAEMSSGNWYTIFEVRYVRTDEHYQMLPDGQERELPMQDYVRVSEPVEISFDPLSDDSIVQKAVESLDEAERKAMAELNEKIARIRERKNQLLALTHKPEPVDG